MFVAVIVRTCFHEDDKLVYFRRRRLRGKTQREKTQREKTQREKTQREKTQREKTQRDPTPCWKLQSSLSPSKTNKVHAVCVCVCVRVSDRSS